MEKVFMDFIDEDFFNAKDFDVSSFIEGLGDMNQRKAFDILEEIGNLKSDDRSAVLANEEIRTVLKKGLLLSSMDNQWYYYRKILKIITPKEFLSLYNDFELRKFFSSKDYGYVTILFAANCEKDVNETVSYVLGDSEMYKYFFENYDNYSSFFSGLDYEILMEVILKAQGEGLDLDYSFLNDISLEYQQRIIDEREISDDTLIRVLPYLSNAVNNHFFMNDPRAIYLYSKLNILSLVKKGIKFSDDILKKKEFFELLKSSSFIKFRNNINSVEKYNNPIIIEEKLGAYYDELISDYDMDSGLFDEYNLVLNNPKKYEFDNSFVFNYDVVSKISIHLSKDESGVFFYKDKNELEAFLHSETSKKLSEIIIDALFRDNIYNVWLNIKEMLRYNDYLKDNDKVLDNDKIDFYKMILNFDNIGNVDKINLYNNLKGKNFSLVFYEDLRSVKDRAYDNIRKELINPIVHPEYIDIVNSDKYGVEVYDLRDKKYTMLVRTQAEFRDVDHYRRSCYSIISNDNTQVFGEYDTNSFLYGYNSFDNDKVLHMFEKDSYSSNFREESSRYVNRIMTSDELVLSNSGYSEVQLVNVKSDDGKYRWNAKKPDFIVVFNHVERRHIEESKRLGIPIVIIAKKKLDIDKKIVSLLDEDLDAYVRDEYSELEHRNRR